MYCGKYAPWEHYPKNLRFSEIQHPLTVIKEFYYRDWPDGHFEDLKKWRYFVINDKNFHDERFGPGELLGTYEANLKLLEALHLLYMENRDAGCSIKIDEKRLNEERQQWYWYPENLSPKELADPYFAIKRVFKKIKPQQFRDYLNDWLNFALSTSAVDETMSTSEILLVYKSVKKLYSAAWLIRQREADKPVLKCDPVVEHHEREDTEINKPVKNEQSIIRVEQTPAEKLALKEVVEAILKAEPAVKAIIHIGTFKEPDKFMLYLLVDDFQGFVPNELDDAIEKAVKPLIRILTIIESDNILKEHEVAKRAFLRYVLAKGIIVYEQDGMKISEHASINTDDVPDTGPAYHEQRLAVAKAHYVQIDQDIEKEDFSKALFSIHQSLEATLQALLFYKTGFKTLLPDIDRLSWTTQLFTTEIESRFDYLANTDPELYELLISAHPDFPGTPPEATLIDVLKLKIELINFRIVVRTLMADFSLHEVFDQQNDFNHE
jgi:hypothetical protein